MIVHCKRIYEPPTTDDSYRILVDRLWPRGISKEVAKLNLWAKEITPSHDLRKRFHQHPIAFIDFEKAYQQELRHNLSVPNFLEQIKSLEVITLLTAAKEIKLSHIPILQQFILANI